MKRLFCFLLLFSALGLAKDRDWQDATLVKIDVRQDHVAGGGWNNWGGGYRSGPVNRAWYIFDTPGIRYVLFSPGKPLNVTVNGHTKLALDGDKAVILDDSGKRVKLVISQKIARNP